MFSDVLSILIAWYAIRLASRPVSSILNNGMTYGWQRAETVGALINGVFLLSLTFFIIMECIQRFVNPVEMKNPLMVICVAGFGLLLNIGGLLLFKGNQ